MPRLRKAGVGVGVGVRVEEVGVVVQKNCGWVLGEISVGLELGLEKTEVGLGGRYGWAYG